MTATQRQKVLKLKQAAMSLDNAMRDIRAALGDSDVTLEYEKELTALRIELQDDITDTLCPAE